MSIGVNFTDETATDETDTICFHNCFSEGFVGGNFEGLESLDGLDNQSPENPENPALPEYMINPLEPSGVCDWIQDAYGLI